MNHGLGDYASLASRSPAIEALERSAGVALASSALLAVLATPSQAQRPFCFANDPLREAAERAGNIVTDAKPRGGMIGSLRRI
jgi:hypothetical protein